MFSKFPCKSIVNVMWKNNHGLLKNVAIFGTCSSSAKYFNQIPRRCIHLAYSQRQNKPQYEYDPATDSFRPKEQKSFTYNAPQKQSPFIKFLRRWTRTLFMITGGIVWGGLIFVAAFVDMKESPDISSMLSHDLDDEVRMLVFYNLANGEDDLSRIVSKYHDKNGNHHEFKIDDFHDSMHKKRDALMSTVDSLKRNDNVNELLGEPVQICGYRVSNKIGELIHIFQRLATRPSENDGCLIKAQNDEDIANKWTAECFLEGSKGIACLNVSFKRKDSESDWEMQNLTLQMMEKSGHVYNSNELRYDNTF